MAQDYNIFGFEELTASFRKLEAKYPNQADAMLMAQGKAVADKTKSLSPVGKTKKLRGSWRVKKPKLYKNGTVRVVRVQSQAPHAHLVEQGHQIVRGGKTRVSGRTLNRVQRSVRGIQSGGRVEGKKMLEKSIREAESRFYRDAEKMLDVLTNDIEA